MRREFASRDDLIDYLKAEFPQAAGVDDHVSPTVGGRAAAEERLAAYRVHGYAKSRNFLDGNVSRLSPYIRHGILSLAEVRDAMIEQVNHPNEANKMVQELGFRDYYQRVYAEIGDGIWQSREGWKTGLPESAYADDVPEDVRQGQTGLACIDAFIRDLRETGYLHNHARMYLAAYLIHWRRVHWRAGASWFLTHLIDGDPASNNLSWQWVASTFSNKPYFFNRENLEKYTGGVHCRGCPLAGRCDFEGSYEALEERLFGR
jgi:deoxyribodipyrimidine photo-lyase